MRYLVMLALAFTLSACSSTGKKKAESKDSKAEATKTSTKSTKKAAAKASGDTVKCEVDGFKREIAIMTSGGNCSVQYTKDGVMSEVANGSAGSDHCATVAGKIRSNLEGNGFKCQ